MIVLKFILIHNIFLTFLNSNHSILLFLSFISNLISLSIDFPNGWETSLTSTGKTLGTFELSAGEFNGNASNKGLKTKENSRHYALAKKFDTPFNNEGKTLVIQYTVKNEQGLDCGGQYLKFGTSDELSQMNQFNSDTQYAVMFGPDICGSTNKVHAILRYKGKHFEWKKNLPAPKDKLTHIFTLIINPDNTYEVQIDGVKKESGDLENDWSFLPPKTIPDPEDKKPEDWEDDPKIPDPEDKKPEDWDSIPQFISDPDAVKPDDWNDEEDGVWEAPDVPNPEYRGEWTQKLIDNPKYKGPWLQKLMDNPEYHADSKLHAFGELNWSAIEIWQVKAGTIFDNILVTDSVEEAKNAADKILKESKVEKEKHDVAEAEKRKKEEEERKKREEEDRKRREEEEKQKAEEEEKQKAEEAAKAETEHDEL